MFTTIIVSLLCLLSESSGQGRYGMQISAWNPGEGGGQCPLCSCQADSGWCSRRSRGGPAETHLCQFLQCLLTDSCLRGDAGRCWAFTPSNSKHATSSFTLQWFSSLRKVCWFVFLFHPFFPLLVEQQWQFNGHFIIPFSRHSWSAHTKCQYNLNWYTMLNADIWNIIALVWHGSIIIN